MFITLSSSLKIDISRFLDFLGFLIILDFLEKKKYYFSNSADPDEIKTHEQKSLFMKIETNGF